MPCPVATSAAAYGWRIAAELPEGRLALHSAEAWPQLTIELRPDPEPGDGEISHPTIGGVVCLDPATGRVRMPLRDGGTPEELVHPSLTVAAFMAARLRGEEAIHAGAYAQEGAGWIVLGDHEQGKSTLLAMLASLGGEVLSDDMSVIRNGNVCAGPRCLDLRPGAAERFGVADSVRDHSRRRMSLPPVRAEHPLRGFLHLRWSETLEIRLLPAHERLRRLVAQIGGLTRRRPQRLLELAALPHYELSRPRDWARAAESARLLQETLAATP